MLLSPEPILTTNHPEQWSHDRLLGYLCGDPLCALSDKTISAIQSEGLTGREFLTLNVHRFCDVHQLTPVENGSIVNAQLRVLRSPHIPMRRKEMNPKTMSPPRVRPSEPITYTNHNYDYDSSWESGSASQIPDHLQHYFRVRTPPALPTLPPSSPVPPPEQFTKGTTNPYGVRGSLHLPPFPQSLFLPNMSKFIEAVKMDIYNALVYRVLSSRSSAITWDRINVKIRSNTNVASYHIRLLDPALHVEVTTVLSQPFYMKNTCMLCVTLKRSATKRILTPGTGNDIGGGGEHYVIPPIHVSMNEPPSIMVGTQSQSQSRVKGKQAIIDELHREYERLQQKQEKVLSIINSVSLT